MSDAYLNEADLRGADLSGADGVNEEELEERVKSLEGATMPDGTIYD